MSDDPGLHHHPPLALAGAAFRRLSLQSIRDRLAPTNSGAPSLPGPAPTWLAASELRLGQRAAIGLCRHLHHLGDKRPRPPGVCAPMIADAAHAGTEISGVVSAHGRNVEALVSPRKAVPAAGVQTTSKTSGWRGRRHPGRRPRRKTSVQTITYVRRELPLILPSPPRPKGLR